MFDTQVSAEPKTATQDEQQQQQNDQQPKANTKPKQAKLARPSCEPLPWPNPYEGLSEQNIKRLLDEDSEAVKQALTKYTVQAHMDAGRRLASSRAAIKQNAWYRWAGQFSRQDVNNAIKLATHYKGECPPGLALTWAFKACEIKKVTFPKPPPPPQLVKYRCWEDNDAAMSQALSGAAKRIEGLYHDGVLSGYDMRIANNAYEAGCELCSVKDALGHGNFRPWLEARGLLQYERRIQLDMKLARHFAKFNSGGTKWSSPTGTLGLMEAYYMAGALKPKKVPDAKPQTMKELLAKRRRAKDAKVWEIHASNRMQLIPPILHAAFERVKTEIQQAYGFTGLVSGAELISADAKHLKWQLSKAIDQPDRDGLRAVIVFDIPPSDEAEYEKSAAERKQMVDRMLEEDNVEREKWGKPRLKYENLANLKTGTEQLEPTQPVSTATNTISAQNEGCDGGKILCAQ